MTDPKVNPFYFTPSFLLLIVNIYELYILLMKKEHPFLYNHVEGILEYLTKV